MSNGKKDTMIVICAMVIIGTYVVLCCIFIHPPTVASVKLHTIRQERSSGATWAVHAMKDGWHCWTELHPYYVDHSRGAWREWLCRPAKLKGA